MHISKNARYLGASSLFAVAMAAAMPATAQEEQDRADDENVILVTAQFREQDIQETPLAITAVTGEMMQARSQTNVAEIANQAPSVTLKPQGAAFGPSMGANIRGVGQFDFNPALEPGVGLYVDDVYYATLTGSIFDLLDLERVEVLRGPQGTLAGKNSIGGAIKLYSRRPRGDNSGFIQGTYGSRDRIDVRAAFDLGITDTLAFRLSGVSKNQGGYVERLDFGCVNPVGSALNPAVGGVQPTMQSSTDCVIDRQGEVGYVAGRGQLRWQPTDTVDINLIGDYTRDERTVAGAVLRSADNQTPWVRGNAVNVPYDSRFLCGRFCNYSSFISDAGSWLGPVATGYPLVQTINDGRVDFEGWGLSGQVDIDLTDNLQFQSITAYRDYRNVFSNDDDLSPLPIGNGSGDLTFWSFSQEARLNGALADDMIEYTIGGFYQDQRSRYATYQDIRYAVIPLQFAGNDPVNADTVAAFAHLSVHLTDALTVTGGIRYTDEHKDYTFSRRDRDGSLDAFLGAVDGVTGVYDGNRVDYRGAVQYQVSDDVMVYAQVSTGFKGGGISPRPFNAAQVVPFGPETLTSYEAGIKTQFLGNMGRFNLAAFRSNYNGIQLTLLSCPQFGGPGPCAVPQNAGDAHVQGLEAELSLRPVDALSIDAAVSVVDFTYTSINSQAGGPTNPAGVQLDDVPPYTPELKWSLGIQYEIDLGNSGTLTPRFDASYQSEVFSGATNTALEHIDGYVLGNARLTWENTEGDVQVSAEVTNLFDKYYFLTAFDLTGAGSGVANAQPGRPREWALTVTKRF
jgi:iron complex outermembrane receptor protein